jgi:hypothetical protein
VAEQFEHHAVARGPHDAFLEFKLRPFQLAPDHLDLGFGHQEFLAEGAAVEGGRFLAKAFDPAFERPDCLLLLLEFIGRDHAARN